MQISTCEWLTAQLPKFPQRYKTAEMKVLNDFVFHRVPHRRPSGKPLGFAMFLFYHPLIPL